MKLILSKRFAMRLAAASVIALVPTAASLADPGLSNVRRHQHYLMTPDGDQVPIGPDFCANPDLQQAFNQFHFNVHHSAVGPHGSIPYDSLGPQDGAPGLHDGEGVDMTAGPCPA